MSKEKVEIKRIVIEMGGKEVELSIDDARKLLAALKDVFNEQPQKEYVPYPQPYPQPYISPLRPYTYPWGTITWGGTVDNTSSDGLTVLCSVGTSDAISVR